MPSNSLSEAIALVKAGKVLAGRSALKDILKIEPGNDLAWLWLAQTMPGDSERLEILAQALESNPQSIRLLDAQQILKDRLADPPIANGGAVSVKEKQIGKVSKKEDPADAPGRSSSNVESAQVVKIPSRSRTSSVLWRIAAIIIALSVVAVIGMALVQVWRNQQAVQLLEEMLTPVIVLTPIP